MHSGLYLAEANVDLTTSDAPVVLQATEALDTNSDGVISFQGAALRAQLTCVLLFFLMSRL